MSGVALSPAPHMNRVVEQRDLLERALERGQYVERDPCPFCEVRGDIGCKHRRSYAAAGTA